jgi:hypothetical protein
MDFVDGDLPNLPKESGGVLGRTIHWPLCPRLASRQHRNLSDFTSFNDGDVLCSVTAGAESVSKLTEETL